MKLIHCADLHLDSKMTANLDKDHAKERKAELLAAYERMVDYAVQHGILGILIAGDMFDTKHILATTRNTVLASIQNHPDITFFYLQGNHDHDNFLSGLEELPQNLKLFDQTWTSYQIGNVMIWGIELNRENTGSAYYDLVLDQRKCNIVMLHGQEMEGAAKDKAEIINIKALRNKGIDYLALGHIHGYKYERLDARGSYCYSGCLEGRGFDECGEHGFVVLDIEEAGTITHEFIPFASRRLYTVEVDVSDCMTTAQMVEKTELQIKEEGCTQADLLKIVLCGESDVECEKDIEYIKSRFKNLFYFVKVADETMLKINPDHYLLDESLKGEYVRTVMADETLSQDEKANVIRYGLQAIAGEEIL